MSAWLGQATQQLRRWIPRLAGPSCLCCLPGPVGELHRAEARGEVAVGYVDECRFSRQAPLALPAVRDSGGHSVLGFWQAHACGQPLQPYVRAGALTADLFVLAVNDFCHALDRSTALVPDNASVHTAHLVRACYAEWAAKGMNLLFLPPYSPKATTSSCSGTAASTTGYDRKATNTTTPCSNASNTS